MPRPLNLIEKLLLNKAIDVPVEEGVKPGQLVRVKVDWIVASELSWAQIDQSYQSLEKPAFFRNDRFWLAADHVVDPRIMDHPKIKHLMKASEKISAERPDIDYHGPNETILHTEFFRERVQPGQVVVGADSHTCSSGGLGAFAVGMGSVDVAIPLFTGETFMEVPETVQIKLVGRPAPGIGGKDVVLYILGKLKRNTVMRERCIEYSGDGLKYLSADARFAISNMATECTAITGVFVPDEVTKAYIDGRKGTKHKSEGYFMRPDEEAEYFASYEIDLALVSPLVALYPSPDNVMTAVEVEASGKLAELDGVFIGACTTALEDLIFAALVLEAGLAAGLTPSGKGHRKVTPGSVQITRRLQELGLASIYEACGFDIEPPGCSYCVGISYAKAAEGETWLSSQNRNFADRMGKGSFGNISSAATVAASSFEMKFRDPTFLVKSVDFARFDELRGKSARHDPEPAYSQPRGVQSSHDETIDAVDSGPKRPLPEQYVGKVHRFGADIDTDAIIAAPFLGRPDTATPEGVGKHVFEYYDPGARQRFKDGYNIIVADEGFGGGSSREDAASGIKGAGVQAVIAKSFSYIYHRNAPNVGLLAITLTDAGFYEAVDADPEAEVTIAITQRRVLVAGKAFPFELSPVEVALLEGGGLLELYKSRGAQLFSKVGKKTPTPRPSLERERPSTELDW